LEKGTPRKLAQAPSTLMGLQSVCWCNMKMELEAKPQKKTNPLSLHPMTPKQGVHLQMLRSHETPAHHSSVPALLGLKAHLGSLTIHHCSMCRIEAPPRLLSTAVTRGREFGGKQQTKRVAAWQGMESWSHEN
jgi:hypothetical protein